MERLNCLRCAYRHEDNGNCTAAGGFCTAVPAAHCRLLKEYLDTGLTPENCHCEPVLRLAWQSAHKGYGFPRRFAPRNDREEGGCIRAGKNIEEAKRELAKQAAQCVEQMMLANDMFFVEGGDKVSWRLRIYAEEEGDDT